MWHTRWAHMRRAGCMAALRLTAAADAGGRTGCCVLASGRSGTSRQTRVLWLGVAPGMSFHLIPAGSCNGRRPHRIPVAPA